MVSTDVLLDGVHFRMSTSTARDVGAKAAAVNLSDLAAMGARPRALLVALTIASGHPDVGELYDGLSAVATAAGAPVVGGDLVVGSVTSLAVTAIGDLPDGARAVRRGGATPGDRVWLTGPVGGSAAGLRIMEGDVAAREAGGAAEELMTRHRRPEARIDAGRELARAGVTAMIDVSDGLVLDARRVAAASGCQLVIEADGVPRAQGVDGVARALGVDPVVFASTAGEDYELLATGPADLPARSGLPLIPVGRVAPGSGVGLTRDGREIELGEGGYLHAI